MSPGNDYEPLGVQCQQLMMISRHHVLIIVQQHLSEKQNIHTSKLVSNVYHKINQSTDEAAPEHEPSFCSKIAPSGAKYFLCTCDSFEVGVHGHTPRYSDPEWAIPLSPSNLIFDQLEMSSTVCTF